jgi:hypothetical protein
MPAGMGGCIAFASIHKFRVAEHKGKGLSTACEKQAVDS